MSLIVVNPQVLFAFPGLQANSVGELLKLARARPGQINYASPGVGSPNHMGMELLKSMAGIDLVHVPYKGGAPASTELIAGQVQLMFNSMPAMEELAKFMRVEHARWERVVKTVGLHLP